MDGPSERVPDVQLKQEVMSDESTEYGGYRTDLGQDTKLHVKSEFRQKQPVVFLEKLDLTLLTNGTYHTSDLQNSPVPFQEPHVDYEEEPDADFRDNPGESAPLERKYVTSSLLSRIKIEEAEEGENPKSELVSTSAVLRLVLKRESDVGSSTNEPSDSRPESERQGEAVTVTGKSEEDGTHKKAGGQMSNRRKNPVVLLERIDPVFVRYHSKTSESASSLSRSAPSSFQLKTEGGSGLDYVFVHNRVPENQGIDRLSMNTKFLSRNKCKTSKTKDPETSTSTPIKENICIPSSETSTRDLNSPSNASTVLTHFSRQNKYPPDERKLKSETDDRHANSDAQIHANGQYSRPQTSDQLSPLSEYSPQVQSKPPVSSPVMRMDKDRPLPCVECSRKFASRAALRRHVIGRHNEDGIFSCEKCSVRFESNVYLQAHLRNFHDSERPSSSRSQSSLSFKSKHNSCNHIIHIRSNDRNFACTQCSRKFKEKRNLQIHIFGVHNNERPFTCDLCSRTFKFKGSLKVHIQDVHSGSRPFPCNHCSVKCRNKSELRRHLKCVHSADQPFSCDHCSLRFNVKFNLKRHVLYKHREDRPFSCGQCSKAFKSKSGLTKHLKCVHSANRPFSCGQCSRSFKSRSKVRRHVLHVHSEDRPFSCGQCSKAFKSKDELAIHIKCVHSADQPFTCAHCSRKFNLKSNLKRHIVARHIEGRLFSCDHCSLKFGTKGQLKTHLMCVRSADRPFSCDQCPHTFTLKCNLKKHVLTVHSENRPFSCGQCSKAFKSKTCLIFHLRCMHSDDRPFSCDQCTRKFKQKSHLSTHVVTVHSENRLFSGDHCIGEFS